MSAQLSESQRRILRTLCDTFVASFKVDDDSTGFWARKASDLGVDCELAMVLVEGVPDQLRAGLLGLLDALNAKKFVNAPQTQREGILREISESSPEAAQGVGFFQKQTVLLTYGLPATPQPDPRLVTYGSPKGQNPNWEVLGYPGPISVPSNKPKDIQTIAPDGDTLTLDADVCIVGSGAGGGVIAAKLAMQGRRVVVLEMGSHYNSSDFHQLELWSYKHLWYRGGATITANGTVNLLAGATLGGGTEINWMNCIRTPALIRENWVREFGLEGVDTAEYDRYMDVVESRLSVGSETAYFNAHNLRMREGCQRLGYLTRQTRINWDPKRFNPLMAGYTGLGDQSGAKQTARRTFLLDAYRHGARFVVHCRTDRILVEGGRAVGVEATYSDPHGRRAKVTVNAPQVVVACGSLESPALLLRSGIGGPVVGRYLRVQPGGAVYGAYKEKQKGWWGSPMTANCEEFTNTGDGFGFYMEIPAFAPGFYASVIPWASARQHKEMITKVPYISTFIWFLREKGHGQVTIDQAGNAVPTYQLSDETDQKNFRHATATAIRIHEAAGAQEIFFGLHNELIPWQRGRQNLETYIQQVMTQPLLDGAQPIISAHQLCTCRMGNDPATSVADTNGELRDAKGVWIGDGSACPTSLGANPMITIMALASRTADKMVGMAESAGNASPGFRPGWGPTLPMFCQILELTARPGQSKRVIEIIRDQAIPRIVTLAEGYVDEIVLQSLSDPDHVTTISFWRDQEASGRFDQFGFDQVNALLKDVVAGKPERRSFHVGASTNPRIRGWKSAECAANQGTGVSGRNFKGMSALPAKMIRGMVGMMNPLNALNVGLRLLSRSARLAEDACALVLEPQSKTGAVAPMVCNIIELTARPGEARTVIEIIRDQAVPRIIRPSEGFIDEFGLQSLSDPNHVTCISFWRNKSDADRFIQYGFDQVSALLTAVLAERPERRPFQVGASTDPRIHGWATRQRPS